MRRIVTLSLLLATWSLAPLAAHAQMQAEEIEVADPFGYTEESYYLDDHQRPSEGVTRAQPRQIPPTYTVKNGDTLWDITARFYKNPWEWPRVWSYNPEVTNPHWIYPQQVLRLKVDAEEVVTLPSGAKVRVKKQSKTKDSLFVSDMGYLDKDALKEVGVIVGAFEEQMYMSPSDQVYVRFDEAEYVRPDKEYIIFREIDAREQLSDDAGVLIRIYGSLKLHDYDKDKEVGRAVITEALDPIERGYKVAPATRNFYTVEPRRNKQHVEAKVVAMLRPIQMPATYNVVFVNAGREQGVEVGNRFFVIHQGDPWQDSLYDDPQNLGATVELPDQPEEYPEETIAELRVIDVQEDSSTCMITSAIKEVSLEDRAEMPKGY